MRAIKIWVPVLLALLVYDLSVFPQESQTSPEHVSNAAPTTSSNTINEGDSLTCGLLNYGGQVYHTVRIVNQCWMSENLNIGKWTDGSQSQKETNNGIIEKYCFNNDFVQCDFWGGLYQWDELMGYTETSGVQGICPPGWHVPSIDDWKSLIRYYGGDKSAGGKLKSTLQWQTPNVGATNASGFSAYPGGYFDSMPQQWHDQYRQSYFWTSEIISKGTAVAVNLTYRDSGVDTYEEFQPSALSVRCIKN
ncbi:MAG: FISUMP domain-containing protein [Bacteroidales bacterium]